MLIVRRDLLVAELKTILNKARDYMMLHEAELDGTLCHAVPLAPSSSASCHVM